MSKFILGLVIGLCAVAGGGIASAALTSDTGDAIETLGPLPGKRLGEIRTPSSSITNATWAQYSGEYQQSPICSKNEITLWSCEAGKRVYSLCSSHTVTRTSGYVQYRASSRGKVVFMYPAERKPPLGSFVYKSFGDGNASIDFTSNGYQYTLFDPLRGGSFISVSDTAPSGKSTEINCGPNQTLQVSYTMKLMYDSGVWADH